MTNKNAHDARMHACVGCRERRLNRCRLTGQIVSVMARMSGGECPIGRWPDSVGKHNGRPQSYPVMKPKAVSRMVYPEAAPRQIQNLAAVTCHFNPCGYKLLEDNYYRFAAALPKELKLWTIELAYGEAPFRLPEGPRMLRVRGDSRHVLWQKERMLNLAIEALPADVDAVAWLDADLIWFNRNWLNETRKLLGRYSVVQLFEHIIDTDREGRFGRRSPGHVHAKTHGLGYGRPGGAWAARREAIAAGLYDRHAIGGGDSAMLCAWEGREDPQISTCSDWNRDFREWANQSRSQVGGSLVCVPGDAVHLYHGTRANRRYVERYKIFHDHAYDPARDVEVDPKSGLLKWSESALQRKPDLVRRVAEYFELRREDE